MKNSNPNNEYQEDEIDLKEIFRNLFNSKKLIIAVTLAFSLLAFIQTTQKEKYYQSSVIIEIGSYNQASGEKKLVEPVSKLIKRLKVNIVYKVKKQLDFDAIEDQLLEIKSSSSSPKISEKVIKDVIRYTQESHKEIQDIIVNSFSEKINAVNNELKFIKNSIKKQQESQQIIAINSIKAVDNEIPILKSHIKYLLQLIPKKDNLLLLVNLQNQIQKLQKEKDTFELQIKSIENGEFISENLFNLQQEKDTLELRLKLHNDQLTTTQPISEIITSEIKTGTFTILIGTILGFIFSIFIVLIRQAFLKKQN